MHTVGIDSSGCKLDRQRNPVKLTTHACDNRRLFVAKLQPGTTCASPFDKESDRGERLSDFGSEFDTVGWASQRI
jgi:hypothetical protein